mmetsp:Transcript_41250/g.96384  ORF Transcript_41250/g.96384 Transcript_41250/m.96384 type:complete len:198 (-) Transcript_41250:110-703(-)
MSGGGVKVAEGAWLVSGTVARFLHVWDREMLRYDALLELSFGVPANATSPASVDIISPSSVRGGKHGLVESTSLCNSNDMYNGACAPQNKVCEASLWGNVVRFTLRMDRSCTPTTADVYDIHFDVCLQMPWVGTECGPVWLQIVPTTDVWLPFCTVREGHQRIADGVTVRTIVGYEASQSAIDPVKGQVLHSPVVCD